MPLRSVWENPSKYDRLYAKCIKEHFVTYDIPQISIECIRFHITNTKTCYAIKIDDVSQNIFFLYIAKISCILNSTNRDLFSFKLKHNRKLRAIITN